MFFNRSLSNWRRADNSRVFIGIVAVFSSSSSSYVVVVLMIPFLSPWRQGVVLPGASSMPGAESPLSEGVLFSL